MYLCIYPLHAPGTFNATSRQPQVDSTGGGSLTPAPTSMASVGGSRLSRHSHAAVGVGKKLYVWGGICDSNSIQASKVECLDVLSTKWEQRQLRGHPFPDRLDRMAVTSHGETGYLFGGRIGSGESQRSNTVYEVNMRSLECRELAPASASPAPRKKSTSGMVHYQHVLVVYGGWTSEGRTTDELHLFDLNTSEGNGCTMCSHAMVGAEE